MRIIHTIDFGPMCLYRATSEPRPSALWHVLLLCCSFHGQSARYSAAWCRTLPYYAQKNLVPMVGFEPTRLRPQILSLLCLPFHHTGVVRDRCPVRISYEYFAARSSPIISRSSQVTTATPSVSVGVIFSLNLTYLLYIRFWDLSIVFWNYFLISSTVVFISQPYDNIIHQFFDFVNNWF